MAVVAATTQLASTTQAPAAASADEVKTLRAALSAVRALKWQSAMARADRLPDSLGAKAVRWLWYTAPGSDPRFKDVARFIEENPDWPQQGTLRRRAEDVLGDATPRDRVLSWFKANPPLTGRGVYRYAEALIAAGRKSEVPELVRNAWVTMNMPRRIEVSFRKRFRKLLTYQTHLDRLDRLLWEGNLGAGLRQARRVKKNDRFLAEARIALRRYRGGVDPAIARVPEEMRDDPGLIYERLRWRRRKGFDDRAVELLEDLPADLVRPDLWWRERGILARRALKDGNPSAAYKLAAAHRQTAGLGFAQAEWLSGWLALRYLEVPDVALDHFTNMYHQVKFPVSKARGAYWAGRALLAAGNERRANAWFRKAAHHVTTFYGQIAATHLAADERPKVPLEPAPTAPQTQAFDANEVVQAIRLMHKADGRELMDPLLKHLARVARTGKDWVLAAKLAREVGRNDEAVKIAKEALRSGYVLAQSGYPWLPVADGGEPEPALVLAVVRQESAFDTQAKSSAGARGLMQVMPATARLVARRLNIRYSREKLTADPDYNLKIGRAYLSHLLDQYDRSLPLALAAYNAGPYRANRWLKQNGDPRQSLEDAVDWIESIPIYETRNYVQRVVENLTVYRQRASGGKLAFSLREDPELGTPNGTACGVTC